MLSRKPFALQKTKPRHIVSRSPLKLSSEEIAREFGPQCQTIQTLVGNQRMTYNIEEARWIPEGSVVTTIDTRESAKLEKQKRDMEEDNNTLRAKVELLLEMLAEVTAEYELRRTG